MTETTTRYRGLVREDAEDWTSDVWVQANAFKIRSLIRRGDARKFDPDELGAVVRAWLTERGVEVDPDSFDAFVFNHHPGGIA